MGECPLAESAAPGTASSPGRSTTWRRGLAALLALALAGGPGCSVHQHSYRKLLRTEEETTVHGTRYVANVTSASGAALRCHVDKVEDVEIREYEVYTVMAVRRNLTGLVLGLGIPFTILVILFIAMAASGGGSSNGGGSSWDWDD